MKSISFSSSFALLTYLASNSQFAIAAPTPSLVGGSFWPPTVPPPSTDAINKRVPNSEADESDIDYEADMSTRVDPSMDEAAIFKAACEGYKVCLAEAKDPSTCELPDEEVSCDSIEDKGDADDEDEDKKADGGDKTEEKENDEGEEEDSHEGEREEEEEEEEDDDDDDNEDDNNEGEEEGEKE